jgi:predicted transcriptional regulator
VGQNAKEEARAIIDQLPDDLEFEDLLYQLYFRHNLAEGMADIEAGRVVPHEEVVRMMKDWRRSTGRAGR